MEEAHALLENRGDFFETKSETAAAACEMKTISWYETRDRLKNGTWEEWEQMVKTRKAAHIAQTVLMNNHERI